MSSAGSTTATGRASKARTSVGATEELGVCKACGSTFVRPKTTGRSGRPREFCGAACRKENATRQERARRATRRPDLIEGLLECKGCRVRFEPTHGSQRYCSKQCQNRFKPRRHGRPLVVLKGAGERAPGSRPTFAAMPGHLPKDPKRRPDNKCVVCEKTIRPSTKQMRRYAGDQIDMDPFCSTECCRKHHGTELAQVGTDAQLESRRAVGIQNSEKFKAQRAWVDHEAAA